MSVTCMAIYAQEWDPVHDLQSNGAHPMPFHDPSAKVNSATHGGLTKSHPEPDLPSNTQDDPKHKMTLTLESSLQLGVVQ
jgi:hypothetical protein